MKTSTPAWVWVLLLSCSSVGWTIDVETLRRHYDRAAEEKEVCELLLEELSKDQSDNLRLGYLGAVQAIWASHLRNPVSKLATFNQGKRNLTEAIKIAPYDVELRLLRYSIQKNCPSFLGYRSDLPADRKVLIEGQASVQSESLLRLIRQIL
jgi:hypothetical protein